MTERFRYILNWCHARGVHQYRTFFRACSPNQAMYDENYARIGYAWNKGAAFVTDADEPWISDMEDTIYAINERILKAEQYNKANEQLK
jgi:hypothetical protein